MSREQLKAMSRADYLLQMLGESRDSIMEYSLSHAETCVLVGKPSKIGLPQFDNLERICNDVLLEQQSPKFIAELMGIKKNGDKWVHPLVGVVEGIDSCKTQSDVVCRLLEARLPNAEDGMRELDKLGVKYDIKFDHDGSHTIFFPVAEITWSSGSRADGTSNPWSRLIDSIAEWKVDQNSWYNKINRRDD